jgi:hypothetical protein
MNISTGTKHKKVRLHLIGKTLTPIPSSVLAKVISTSSLEALTSCMILIYVYEVCMNTHNHPNVHTFCSSEYVTHAGQHSAAFDGNAALCSNTTANVPFGSKQWNESIRVSNFKHSLSSYSE